MGFIDVPAAMKRADELLTQKETIQEQIKGVREALRTAVVDGDTNPEQTKWIKETFPAQETKTPEQRVQAAKERLEDTEKKAAEAAAKQDGKGTGSRSRTRAAA